MSHDYKRQPMRNLLIDTSQPRRMSLRHNGKLWITDSYTIARADLFARVLTSPNTPKVEWLAGVRKELDASPSVVSSRVTKVGVRIESTTAEDSIVVSSGALMVAVNERVFDGWMDTGLTPYLSERGRILWHGGPRNTELFGVLLPVHPSWLGATWSTVGNPSRSAAAA